MIPEGHHIGDGITKLVYTNLNLFIPLIGLRCQRGWHGFTQSKGIASA